MGKLDGFKALLDRIRRGAHPAYGALEWNGKSRQLTETVLFENSGAHEPDEVVRARALAYLEALTEKERAAVEVRVEFREEKPVRAIITGDTAQLSPERVAELRRLVEESKREAARAKTGKLE